MNASVALCETDQAGLLRQQRPNNLVRQISDMSAQSVSSCPEQHKDRDMDASRPLTGRTPRQPNSAKLNKRDTAELVAAAIHEDYGRFACRHTVIANDAGAASEKTAKAWTNKESLPGLEYFLNLGRNSPAIQKMVLRLWGLERDLDPDFQRELNAFIQRVQEMQR